MAIGERIRFLRTLRRMTQKELGLAAGFPEKNASIRMATIRKRNAHAQSGADCGSCGNSQSISAGADRSGYRQRRRTDAHSLRLGRQIRSDRPRGERHLPARRLLKERGRGTSRRAAHRMAAGSFHARTRPAERRRLRSLAIPLSRLFPVSPPGTLLPGKRKFPCGTIQEDRVITPQTIVIKRRTSM